MQPERWRQIEEIFHSAIDCAPEKRSELLDAACGSDVELRREIESLLEYQEKNWTESSAFQEGVTLLEQRRARANEDLQIGSYRVLREIGRGGMGTVYLAARADAEFKKLVAIKIIRRGLDTDDIVQRFRSERQILAMLDHPNIARLLDGGSTNDGLPYFVMEYIEGEPIDVFCDSRHLNITERLRLFQGVCTAVSYAHQHLVIHRDIKPGNVLVKDGVPRLLDFGIAKVLAAENSPEERTRTGIRPLTPEYASPEQTRGTTITTASDVYGLGVLLYELLTGHRPLTGLTQSELERAICEQDPQRPSMAVRREAPGDGQGLPRLAPADVSHVREGTTEKLSRRLQGDLDNIVLKALRKEPQRRYASAEQLSEDIDRHLANLPVRARPDTRGYRAAKFIQRNQAWVAMAALAFLSLAGGVAMSLRQTHVARLEQAKSARINAFLQEMIGKTWRSANQKGRENTVSDMLDDAAQRVETELSDQPEVKAEMLGTIGGAYVGQARYDLAARYLAQAYDLNVTLYGPEGRPTGTVMHALAGLAYLTGNYAGADSWFQKSVPIYRRYINDPDFDVRELMAMLSDAAFVARALGRLDEAERLWREALVNAPRLPARNRSMGITVKTFLAQLYVDRGEIDRADPLALEASRELRAVGDRVSLAQSLIDLGNVRRLQGRYPEAEPLLREGIELYGETQGDDHPNVAYGLLGLANLYLYEGRYDLAEQETQQALAIVNKLPKGTNYYASAYGLLGRVICRTGRTGEAEQLLREALAIRKQNSHRAADLAIAQEMLGECLITEKQYAEAETLLLESYRVLKNVHVPQSPILKETRAHLATVYAALGNPSPVIQ